MARAESAPWTAVSALIPVGTLESNILSKVLPQHAFRIERRILNQILVASVPFPRHAIDDFLPFTRTPEFSTL